jgi:hypothetical protein
LTRCLSLNAKHHRAAVNDLDVTNPRGPQRQYVESTFREGALAMMLRWELHYGRNK